MLMMKRIVLVAVLSLLSWLANAEGDVAQLHLHLSSAQTLSADFEQTVFDADSSALQQSSGTIQLKRPNKIRWESKQPYRYLLISDGKTLWRYDADLEQLNKEPFDPSLAQAPAMIIGASIEQLAENFSVSLKKQGSERAFTLVPKEGGAFSKLTLYFKAGKLTGMALVDSLEQTTEIEFIQPRYNGKLPDSLFVYREEDSTN